jgi:hypothetical protein
MEIEDLRERFEATQLPPLWPVPSDYHMQYAVAGGVSFSWNSKGYCNNKSTALRTKTLNQLPLTQEGWERCWSTLQRDHPELAKAVEERARKRQKSLERLTHLRAHEETFRTELLGIDVLTSIPKVILLGGHGYSPDVGPRTRMDLYFTPEGLWATRAGTATPVIQCSFSEVNAVEFSGPGKITRGGGFIGGGFGLKGAAEGMAIAAVLNSVTTKSEIRSVIRWEARALEAFFFTDTATPGDLRIQLSAVLGQIKQSAPAVVDSVDPLDWLERLAKMHQDESLTNEEFATLKRRLIEGGD